MFPLLKVNFDNDTIYYDKSNYTITISFRECIEGEFYRESTNTCEKCAIGKYTVKPS